MSEFKWRHFEGEIILWAVRWYCRYGISYRDLEQMMGEREVGQRPDAPVHARHLQQSLTSSVRWLGHGVGFVRRWPHPQTSN